MRHFSIAVGIVLCVCAQAFAVFVHDPLPSPPKADEIGEVFFERSDWSTNNSEHVTMDREDFIRFFSEGTFQNNDTKSPYDSKKYAEPLNEKGGWQYCRGAFATKSGKVFSFNRSRVGVLAIEDSQHRSGWLILSAKK